MTKTNQAKECAIQSGGEAVTDLGCGALPFGRYFSKHLFSADFKNGQWGRPCIEQFQDLRLHPSFHGLNYGISVIDGLKAHKTASNDSILLFRPRDHLLRLNHSARRYCIPEVPWELFNDGLKRLIDVDRGEVPVAERGFLYLRPMLFSTDQQVGFKVPESFKLVVIASPSGEFFSKPIHAFVMEDLPRAWPGGTGNVKSPANYGAALLAQKQAVDHGCDTVIWLDGTHHKWIEECGTMNIFFAFEDCVVTPPVCDTILSGITRDSVLTLLRSKGVRCEERKISVHEVLARLLTGQLRECFGTGTAATVIAIDKLRVGDAEVQLPTVEKGRWWHELGDELRGIMCGSLVDRWNWVHPF